MVNTYRIRFGESENTARCRCHWIGQSGNHGPDCTAPACTCCAGGRHEYQTPAAIERVRRAAKQLIASQVRSGILVPQGDGVYQVTERKARVVRKPAVSMSFAAFCRPRLNVPVKQLTFAETMSAAGMPLHPAGCWCPRHNATRQKAAA